MRHKSLPLPALLLSASALGSFAHLPVRCYSQPHIQLLQRCCRHLPPGICAAKGPSGIERLWQAPELDGSRQPACNVQIVMEAAATKPDGMTRLSNLKGLHALLIMLICSINNHSMNSHGHDSYGHVADTL